MQERKKERKSKKGVYEQGSSSIRVIVLLDLT